MTEPQNIPWKRIAVEAAAIVVSILLAFAIDAWWDDRQDAATERVILSSLLVELRSVESRIDLVDQRIVGIRDSAMRLLDAAVGPNDSLEDRDIDRLLADLTWYIEPNGLITPELDSLVASQDLSIISSNELRRKLTVWQRILQDVQFDLQTYYQFYRERFMPFLESNSSMQQIYNVSNRDPGNPSSIFPGDEVKLRILVSHRNLLSEKHFQNLLSQRIINLTDTLEFRNPQVEPELREIVRLIEQELQN